MKDYPKVTNVVYMESCFWCFCFEAAWLQGEWCFCCWAPVSKGTTLKKGFNPWQCDWILNSVTLQYFTCTDKCASVTVIFSPPEARYLTVVTWSLGEWAQLMNGSGDRTWWVPVWQMRTEEFLICSNSDFAPTAHLPVQLFWRLWVWFSSVAQC